MHFPLRYAILSFLKSFFPCPHACMRAERSAFAVKEQMRSHPGLSGTEPRSCVLQCGMALLHQAEKHVQKEVRKEW